MIEYRYEVWAHQDEWSKMIASGMSLDGALLFVEAWMHKYRNESLGLEIRPMTRKKEVE